MQTTKSVRFPGVIPVLLFIIVLATGCTNKKNVRESDELKVLPYPHIIDISEGLSNPSEIRLSEIADSIRYVVLSKDKQEVIGDVDKIQISDRVICI